MTMNVTNLNKDQQINSKMSSFSVDRLHAKNINNPEFQQSYPPHIKNAPKKVKTGVFFTTLLGVGTAMAFALKGKFKPNGETYSLNPSKIFKTLKNSPKDLGLFGAVYDSEKKEVEKLVGKLAVGTVAGGLLGGAIFDKKENMKAKLRESIIQLVGNIFTPLACVSGANRVFKKYGAKYFKQALKTDPLLTKITRGLPALIVSGSSLLVGISLGNKVGNFINEKIFHIKDKRKVKMADMSPHVDDLCLAVSLVSPGSSLGAVITRFVPAALMVAGYSTGVMQEKPEILAKNAKDNA